MASVFHLKRGQTLVGTLAAYGGDMPWLHCEFEPAPAFEAFRPLFDREMELAEAEAEEGAEAGELEEVCRRIAASGLCLVLLPEGTEIGDFMLHVRGGEAWFTTDWARLRKRRATRRARAQQNGASPASETVP